MRAVILESRRHCDQSIDSFFFVMFLNYIQASLETDTIKLPLPLPFSCSSSVMYKCIKALIGGMRVLWVPMSSES